MPKAEAMIEEPPLLEVRKAFPRPRADQIAQARAFSTGIVSDALADTGALSSEVRFLGSRSSLPVPVVGPAITAENAPGDILGTLAAMNFVREGDVLVAAAGAFRDRSAGGDLVMAMLRNAGAAGFVTHGPVRDSGGIARVGLPVWCAGLHPASPFTTGPGRVGLSIRIGGRTVASGDLVVADRDGVVIVPSGEIDAVIERCAAIAAQEHAYQAEIAAGRRVSRKALAALEDTGTRFIE